MYTLTVLLARSALVMRRNNSLQHANLWNVPNLKRILDIYNGVNIYDGVSIRLLLGGSQKQPK